MAINKEDVSKVAHLARIAVDGQDIARFADDLSGVFELMNTLDQFETQKTEPLAHPLDISQRLREDKALEADQRMLLQENAPLTEAGLYLVPQVIE